MTDTVPTQNPSKLLMKESIHGTYRDYVGTKTLTCCHNLTRLRMEALSKH
jgi:hypothetical protein